MARACTSCRRTFPGRLIHCPYDGATLVRSPGDTPDYENTILDNRYKLSAKIAEGGMCTIYQAMSLATGQTCAIKMLQPDLSHDSSSLSLFRKEIEVSSLITHPNVVKMLDANALPDTNLYLVMELMAGTNLKEELQRHGPFNLKRLNHIIQQVCSALTATHSQGIIHQDLKPDNVMLLKASDGQDIAKLFDFGFAKFLNDESVASEHSASIVMGTPRYMSPEQCSGQTVDIRSDIYSLGIIVYEMIAGNPPFTDASSKVLLSKHMQEPIPSLKLACPNLPDSVERVVLHALEKSPLRRPQSVPEFAKELAAAINDTIDNSLSPSLTKTAMARSNLVPIVKQTSGAVSIVEYTAPLEEKSFHSFSPEQIKSNFKNNWSYWAIGLIGVLILAVIVIFIYLIASHQ